MGGRGDRYRDNPFEESGIKVPVYAVGYNQNSSLLNDLKQRKSVTLTTDKRKAGNSPVAVYVDSNKATINKTDIVVKNVSAIKII